MALIGEMAGSSSKMYHKGSLSADIGEHQKGDQQNSYYTQDNNDATSLYAMRPGS
jgi:hypothetical protein